MATKQLKKSTPKDLQFYTGNFTWLLGDVKLNLDKIDEVYKTKVNRGIKRGKEFVIDFASSHDVHPGLIRLKTNDGFDYYGTLEYTDNKYPSCKVNLRLYESKHGCFFIGLSIEGGHDYTLLIELTKTKTFSVTK
jgi:hypothetical protein